MLSSSLPLPAASLFPPFFLSSVLSLPHPLFSPHMVPVIDPIFVFACLFAVCAFVEWSSKSKSPVHPEVGFEALVRSIVVEPVDADKHDPVWDAFARSIVIPGDKAPAAHVPTLYMVLPIADEAPLPDFARSNTTPVAEVKTTVNGCHSRVQPRRIRTRTETPVQPPRASSRGRNQSASGYALPEPVNPLPVAAASVPTLHAVEILPVVEVLARVCRPDRVRVPTETSATPPGVSSRVRTHSASGLLVLVTASARPAGAAVERILPLSPLRLPRVASAPSPVSLSRLAESTRRSPLSLLAASSLSARVLPVKPTVFTRPSPATDIPGAVIYDTRPPASCSLPAKPAVARPSRATVIPGAVIYGTPSPTSRGAPAQPAQPAVSSPANRPRPSPATAVVIPGSIIYQTWAAPAQGAVIYSTSGMSTPAYPLQRLQSPPARRASKIVYHGDSAPRPRAIIQTRAFLQAQQQAASQPSTARTLTPTPNPASFKAARAARVQLEHLANPRLTSPYAIRQPSSSSQPPHRGGPASQTCAAGPRAAGSEQQTCFSGPAVEGSGADVLHCGTPDTPAFPPRRLESGRQTCFSDSGRGIYHIPMAGGCAAGWGTAVLDADDKQAAVNVDCLEARWSFQVPSAVFGLQYLDPDLVTIRALVEYKFICLLVPDV
ncbi:hypothetical protein B0H19DRAFT_1076096 [Mycena capillaripes]|nr:hypothetical protein B0H19DRAFT_1076096 [Mycena capillaripes]